MDRTRTVIARTRGFQSDGRKEDDGADKSAANLTRPFRFVGLWLLWLRSSWTDEGERRTRERADEGKSRREEKSAAKLPRSFSWDFSRLSAEEVVPAGRAHRLVGVDEVSAVCGRVARVELEVGLAEIVVVVVLLSGKTRRRDAVELLVALALLLAELLHLLVADRVAERLR